MMPGGSSRARQARWKAIAYWISHCRERFTMRNTRRCWDWIERGSEQGTLDFTGEEKS